MKDINVFKPLPHPWYRLDEHVPYFFSMIKFAFQRAFKGYCDLDVMDMDSYLIDVIPGMLTEMVKNSQGYPVSFDGPYGSKLFLEDKHQEWLKYLTETAKLFRALSPAAVDDQIEMIYDKLLEDGDTEKYHAAYAEIEKKRELLTQKAFNELLKHFYELWW